MNGKLKQTISDIISALFIALFSYAAFSKLLDFENFRVQLGKSPVLNFIAAPIAYLVPGIEIFIVLALVVKRTQYMALYASFSLMVIFSTYIVAILKFSSYVPCSCGGILQNMTWTEHFWFNISFIALGAIAVLLYQDTTKDLMAVRGER